jgi:hypothetical protein
MFKWFHRKPKETAVPITSQERTATWDGKDFAAVQIATFWLPRVEGRPAAEVNKHWDLTILGTPVAVGTMITVTKFSDGRVNWEGRKL